MLKLYNSMGRKLQPFKPIKEGEVKMYTCGPTVWNYAHVGNYRTFVFEDVLRRYLAFKGYRVIQVMNITDVEDKIIKGIRESHKSLKEHTKFYEDAFFDDLRSLNVEKAEYYPRATDHIPEMVALVKNLLKKGYAYRSPDGSVYFQVSKFGRYGALSGVKVGEARAGKRVSQDHYEEKAEAVDFALWKAWDPADGDVFWETELGKGRPGWHIECSAMSMRYLGESFDIHTGGVDNRFPHHENELAQSEAATGKTFANFWLHSGHLMMEGEEMHKSIGNVVYLRDLAGRGWESPTVRLFLLSTKYRDQVDLTDESLSQARAQRTRLQELVSRLKGVSARGDAPSDLADGLVEGFEAALDDDLNTPDALASVFKFAKKANQLLDAGKVERGAADAALRAMERLNSVLGVLEFGEKQVPAEVAALVEEREAARKRKDFAESDRLRGLLQAMGYFVDDTPAGPRVKRSVGG